VIRLVAALIGAATLEAGGNALLRQGLLRAWWPLMLAGIATLGLYGLLVNQSGLNFDFGRLMACYIVAFFLVSQILAAIIFGDLPSSRTLLGGTLILVGGLTILI
jgi:drug/metabolite transporter superfamily protein YnfA